ncbi:ParB/RepB/Spo0J family partition protein [Occultella glacieicola]|uniref:ParB/RepB/Spo0J family partition protein n=1 Tax=Occultella glacieicola TaxID=2518684 RepID=A0ABY2ED87_9MICO|nr:ParB/RepB/Spo0J family partition protein [Occultella glacieicola]TDE98752.1 ParB/RepB/Spo0J family partition protein [Occultella glacieicola]
MTERRRGLGRGLGALIPTAPTSGVGGNGRPVDVFFPDSRGAATAVETPPATDTAVSADSPPESSPSGPDEARPAGVDDTGVVAPAQAPTAGAGTEVDDRDEDTTRQDVAPGARSQAAAPAGDGPATEPVSPELRPVPGARFAELPLDAIRPNANQPRQVFDEDELEELSSSIREVGVLQPVVVRPSGTDVEGRPTYELIMGERRWRASRLAGNDTVPAIIRDTAQDDMLRDALLENLHRAQLNPLEEAAAYQQLLDDFGCTHDELATKIARSRPQISNTLRLLKLPPLVQRRVAAGVLSAGHARALLGLPDGGAMERLAQRIVAEGLSVRATEEIVTLGDDPIHPEMRRRPRAGDHSEALDNLAVRLSDRLDTKVKVNLGQRKGRINIEFASVQDLNRILNALAPDDPGVLQPASE